MKLQQWAYWAEIAASLGVVVTLVLLIQEVRGNTKALERQATLDRATSITFPFFASPELPAVLAKIKAVDGLGHLSQAFVERYDLTPAEAILWQRHLIDVWMGLEADYSLSGESQELESAIRFRLTFPDNQVYWEHSVPFSGADFREYVEGVREGR